MQDPQFVKRYKTADRPGAYARVLREGVLRAGEPVRLESYIGDRISLREIMRTYGQRLDSAERARYLAAPIAERLRAKLEAAS